MITGMNEAKTFAKYISYKYVYAYVICICKFNSGKCNSDQKWNNDKLNQKEYHVCEKDYTWKPAACACENGKHLECINDDSGIMYDEITEMTKTVQTKTVPTKKYFNKFLYFTGLSYYSIVSIYCYLIKY